MKDVTNTRKIFSEWLVHEISCIVLTKKNLFTILSYRKYINMTVNMAWFKSAVLSTYCN